MLIFQGVPGLGIHELSKGRDFPASILGKLTEQPLMNCAQPWLFLTKIRTQTSIGLA